MVGLSKYQEYLVGNTLVIPEGITQIDESAFSGCEDIEHIVFPNSLTKIGRSAFYNCLSLKSICFSEGLLFIDHTAFCGCKKLSSISLPNSLTFIGDNAFSRTGISSVTIPAKVECIYCNPFQDCKLIRLLKSFRKIPIFLLMTLYMMLRLSVIKHFTKC